jgi:hypothetical protein
MNEFRTLQPCNQILVPALMPPAPDRLLGVWAPGRTAYRYWRYGLCPWCLS